MQAQKPAYKYFLLTKDTPTKVQQDNIQAILQITSIIKTCLGPRAFQKMLLTKIGGIETTNDGNSILRELDVSHPALKILFELARTQDEEAGDGTTSVVILCAEILNRMGAIVAENHPIVMIKYLRKYLEVAVEFLNEMAVNVRDCDVQKLVSDSVSTKLCSILKVDIDKMALTTARMIYDQGSCDIKKNVRVEKILGNLNESYVLNGLLINKNIVHPQMRRRIENPKVVIVETGLEYKKGESQINFEFSKEEDFTNALKYEEEQIIEACQRIIELQIDIICVEKGISDLALSILQSNNVTALRRFKKFELERLAKVTGARIVNRVFDLEDSFIGNSCNLFDYVKINDEYYCQFITSDPKACSVVLRGPSKDIMNELERNFMDAIKVAKNVLVSPKICPGGGATEMAISKAIIKYIKDNKINNELEKSIAYNLSEAMKIIPALLATNSGFDSLQLIPEFELKQENFNYYGVNGITGKIEDMREIVMEPLIIKTQCIKSAIETVCMLLRVDGIIQSGNKK
ncbi:T-complex protein 1 subunit gamma [Conglomerata obtusa]